MPNVHDLIESIQQALGRDPRDMSPTEAAVHLVDASRPDLALAIDREVMRLPADLRNRALSIDPAEPVSARHRRNLYNEMLTAVYSEPSPMLPPPSFYDSRQGPPTHRPPAKPPTATTTIGPAEPVDADYAALVAELGINSAAVDLEAFKALVPQLGLRIYDRAEVQEYLHCLYKIPVGDLTPAVTWGWRPLRAIDQNLVSALVQFNGKVQRAVALYSKPIPYPVLLTVKAVRDACPSARFFVSDEMQGERIPDPFLLVQIAGEEFVIERWDEPAFRGKQ